MIYPATESADDDHWDWLADRPLLGAHADEIETGLAAEFRQAFCVRSTDNTVSIPKAIQEISVKDQAFFVNTEFRRSALVLDANGWAFVCDLVTDETTLKDLMRFQQDVTRLFAQSAQTPPQGVK